MTKNVVEKWLTVHLKQLYHIFQQVDNKKCNHIKENYFYYIYEQLNKKYTFVHVV